uniref:Uncharacterized protein n=1 Tax=Trichobilharzia regenti TaxID=157069 RepID=A0AA85K1K1_TRIRE|nr:unnamed protein product [Trichobilharzia regenti]
MSLWLQVSLLVLCSVIFVSSLPTSLRKQEFGPSENFDGSDQLIDNEGVHPRGRNKSRKHDQMTTAGERRGHRRRRKHNRQCELTGDCPEGTVHRKPHRRGRKRRTRCNSDTDCPSGQTCKERRHGGRKHHSNDINGIPLDSSPSSSSSSMSISGVKSIGNKVCREKRHSGGGSSSRVLRRSGAL